MRSDQKGSADLVTNPFNMVVADITYRVMKRIIGSAADLGYVGVRCVPTTSHDMTYHKDGRLADLYKAMIRVLLQCDATPMSVRNLIIILTKDIPVAQLADVVIRAVQTFLSNYHDSIPKLQDGWHSRSGPHESWSRTCCI